MNSPAAAVESYLDWLAVERGRSTNTLLAYRRDLGRYLRHLTALDIELGSATADDVALYVESLRVDGLAPSSVKRSVVVMRGLYRYLAAEAMIEVDPTAGLETPRTPAGLPRALTESQVLAVLGHAAQGDGPVMLRDRALLEVLYGSGVRISEAVGLSLVDVDLESRLMRVTGKGSKERIVPIGRHAARALAVWLDEGRAEMAPRNYQRRTDAAAVFLNQRGGRLTRQGGWLILAGHAAAVGLGDVVSPHVLRHSCATHMLDHGADIRAVQELLGHGSISTTQLYTKVVTERLWAVYAASHPRASAAPATAGAGAR